MEDSVFEEKKRPDFLKVLCILTFIGAGFGIIGGIMTMFFSNVAVLESLQKIMEDAGQDSSAFDPENFSHAMSKGLMVIVLNILALVGAVMMFNLNKLGFYLYAIAQISMLFVGVIHGGMESFSYFSLIWNALWIGMYASNLKFMKSCGCASCCTEDIKE